MKIERKKLLAALEPLKPALTVRTVVQALTQIWFDKDFAYAHDGGMGVRVILETPFHFGVPGQLLLGLLNQAQSEEITLEPKDEALVFKAGKSAVKLTTLDPGSMSWPYPAKPTGKPKAIIKVSEDFAKALKRVFTLRPSSPKRMEHHGICVFAMDTEMDLYTTDSKSIAVATVQQGLKGLACTVLPRAFAEQLVVQCDKDVELQLYEDHFRVRANEDVTLYSNVFDTSQIQDLPAVVDRIYDTKTAPPFTIPKELPAALERAVLLAGSEEPVVTLSTNGSGLVLSGKFKYGELAEEFAVDKALPKRSVSVVAKTLLSAYSDVDRMMIGADAVTLRGKDGFIYFLALYDY